MWSQKKKKKKIEEKGVITQIFWDNDWKKVIFKKKVFTQIFWENGG